MAERHLQAVNTETGELHEIDGCPHCKESEEALVQLERQNRTLQARITRLQRDEEAEARRHKLWTEAETVHTWWKLATGHFRVRFKAEDFYNVMPRLTDPDHGLIGVLKAIAGAAYNPSTTTMKNGREKRYDSFELLNRSDEKLRDFQERAPGEAESEQWKLWLLRRIESNIRPAEPEQSQHG